MFTLVTRSVVRSLVTSSKHLRRSTLQQGIGKLVQRKMSKQQQQQQPSSTHFFSTFSNDKQYDIQFIEEIRKEFGATPAGELRLNMDNNTGVATLCLINPGRKNCLTGYMMAQLADVIDELQQWKEGKALVIYGDQGFFCSGGDLDTVRTILSREGGRKMIALMQYNLDRLQCLPLITVAYVQGMSLGGGCELMTACDYRLAAPEAKLGFVQIRLGISTVWGGGARLVQLLGYNKALELMATGKTFTAQEGHQLGFVDRVMDKELEKPKDAAHERQLILADTKEFLRPFIQHPRQTMLVAKQICSDTRYFAKNLNRALAKELEHGLKIWGGPVHSKALSGKVNHKKQ